MENLNEKVIYIKEEDNSKRVIASLFLKLLFLIIALEPILKIILAKTYEPEGIIVIIIAICFIFPIIPLAILMMVFYICANITFLYRNLFLKGNENYMTFKEIYNSFKPSEVLKKITLNNTEINFVYANKKGMERTVAILRKEIIAFKIYANLTKTGKHYFDYLQLDIELRNDENFFLNEDVLPSDDEKLLFRLIEMGKELPNFKLDITSDVEREAEKNKYYENLDIRQHQSS